MKRRIAILTISAMLLSSYMTMQAPASAAASASSSATAIASSAAKAQIVGGVNLRNKPSLSSGKVIGFLKKGSSVSVLDQSNKYYYKVKTTGGQTGYVSKSSKYIKVSGNASQSKPSQGTGASNSLTDKVNLVISTGKKYLGTPYEFGSDRKTTATFDCSDFVRQAYKEALGIVLPSDSRKQGDWIKDQGTAVYNIGSLKAGDLVFFMSYKGSSASAYSGVNKSTEKITHVAIYLGNGQLLHTYSSKSGGVRIDTLSKSWEYRFLFGGSVLK
ncbi:D-gamma-glutamyl-meso-diaminopimelic acid endopeptidase CwlS precursor [compost metagenome]